MGVLAKTDRIDAALLARMGAMLALEPAVTHPVLLSDLKQLLVARDALVKDRTAARNRAKTVTLGVLKRQLAQRLRQIARQMHIIEDEIAALIASDRQLARKFAILTSIPGISQVTAFALIIDMPELGMRDGKKIASLAPMTRQSGRWKGKAFITGGRAQIVRVIVCTRDRVFNVAIMGQGDDGTELLFSHGWVVVAGITEHHQRMIETIHVRHVAFVDVRCAGIKIGNLDKLVRVLRRAHFDAVGIPQTDHNRAGDCREGASQFIMEPVGNINPLCGRTAELGKRDLYGAKLPNGLSRMVDWKNLPPRGFGNDFPRAHR